MNAAKTKQISAMVLAASTLMFVLFLMMPQKALASTEAPSVDGAVGATEQLAAQSAEGEAVTSPEGSGAKEVNSLESPTTSAAAINETATEEGQQVSEAEQAGTGQLQSGDTSAEQTINAQELAALSAQSSDSEPAVSEVVSLTTQASQGSVSYSTHVQNIGWQGAVSNGSAAGTTGQSLRLEGITITISGVSGDVQYATHVQNIGWQDAVANGQVSGTTGQSLRLEAIKIWLSGDAASRFDILYRTHVQNVGWQDWVENGAIAGTTGQSLRLEAIEIKLSEKASAALADGSVGVAYQSHVQNVGWQGTVANGATSGTTGQALRVEAIKIFLSTGSYSGGVSYQAHVQDVGWQGWVDNGSLAGTTGQSLRVEALRIKLTGDMANLFSVQYRTHVQNIGWQPWVMNGVGSGTAGQSLRIEAIEIRLVDKKSSTGWEENGSSWGYRSEGTQVKNSWVVTDVNPLEEFNFDIQRYWIDSNGSMAVSRYVNPGTGSDSNAGWVAYASDKGYVLRGKHTMSDGVLLANNDGAIPTAAGWCVTDAYDGSLSRYYLISSGPATVAKVGLFTVDGSRYYGVPGEGYVMITGYRYIDGSWYSAASDGKLTIDTSGNVSKYIESYINWALAIAADDSHGYSQADRWGPDYDCSSFVISSLKASGFAVGNAGWTGNMVSELTKYGFTWNTNLADRQRGDLLFVHNSSHQHTEIYLGNGQNVGAHSSETGGIYGQTGDQTGREICVVGYYDMPWDGFLRYVG